MTVKDIKNSENFKYEINIDEDYYDFYYRNNDVDEWGCAYVWLDDIGVEYNFCIDSGLSCCAIYPVFYIKDYDYYETECSSFVHYDIEWGKDNWRELLLDNLCEALITLHKL